MKKQEKISGALAMLADIQTNVLFIFRNPHAKSTIDTRGDTVGHYESKYHGGDSAYR